MKKVDPIEINGVKYVTESHHIEETETLYNAIVELKGLCLSEIDHAFFCEEELKRKDQWCAICRALLNVGIHQKCR